MKWEILCFLELTTKREEGFQTPNFPNRASSNWAIYPPGTSEKQGLALYQEKRGVGVLGSYRPSGSYCIWGQSLYLP